MKVEGCLLGIRKDWREGKEGNKWQ
jgi:hypothetical protein